MPTQPLVEWKEDDGGEYWDAIYHYRHTFSPVTEDWLSQNPVKMISPPFGDNRWHISIGTIQKAGGFMGVFLGAAVDHEVQTSKVWLRHCITCTASLGTPGNPAAYGIDKNISGGYTFHSGLESRRGQAKYIKLERLFADPGFCQEKELFVEVKMTERRKTYKPSPFGDIQHFSRQTKIFLSFFDNPDVADVCFVFPRRNGKGSRTIYAQKAIIRSAAYFQMMFDSGFMESAEVESQDGGDTEGEGDAEDITRSSQRDSVIKAEPSSSPVAVAIPVSPAASLSSFRHRTAGVAESVISGDGVYWDDDSDAELDEMDNDVRAVAKAAGDLSLSNSMVAMDVDGPPSKKRRISQIVNDDGEQAPPRGKIHRIVIKDTAYTTYRALLLYLYSNSIAWAPLRSQYELMKERTESKSRKMVSRARFNREFSTKFTLSLSIDQLEPTSPKSMYVLCDMLQLLELKDEALKQFKRSLSHDNLATELLSPLAARYDAVGDMIFQHMKENWSQVSATPAWKQILEDGLGSLQQPLQEKIFRFIATLTVPRPLPNPS